MAVSPTAPPPAPRLHLETPEQWARFLSGFVHELKTPLASLGMVAELLDKEEGARLGAKGRRYTGNLRELAHEIGSLVHDAGTLARLLEGRRTVRTEPVTIAAVFARVAEAARSGGWERGVSLLVDLDPALPAEMLADAGLLEEALTALLETSIALAQQEVTVEVSAAGGALVVAVAPDTGCGPELGADALLEDPFGGATSRRLRQKGVRPLAPLVAREAARLLGGDATIVSADGRTRCLLRLPLAPPG